MTESRRNEADLLAHIAEVDRRELYLEQGCSSMFDYCTRVLHFSEATAFCRISVARAARRHPLLLEGIREGALHLAGAKLLVPALTPENCVELLDLARHQSKRAIERLLADRAPKPDVPERIRKLPDEPPVSAAKKPAEAVPAASATPPPGTILREPPQEASGREVTPPVPTPAPRQDPPPSPLGSGRFHFQFTGDQEVHEMLEEAKGLLSHQHPGVGMAEIVKRGLALLIEDARRKKFAETSRPRKRSKAPRKAKATSRYIPAEIKRAVVARDGGRCAFVAKNGRRCGSRHRLEFHHLEPWARVQQHSADGIELRCQRHNRYAAVQDFGETFMARFTKQDDWSREQLNAVQLE